MYFYTWNITLGPFIQEKISRGLHKTRTPRRNGTKSMFTAYSTKGRLEGFWDGLIQAAAYLGRESVRINALKRCPRLAEAVNDCCACSVFNYIPDLHGRETRVPVARKWVLFTFTKWKKADRDSCKKKKCEECPRRKTNPAHIQRAWDCGDISMKPPCLPQITVESFVGVFT